MKLDDLMEEILRARVMQKYARLTKESMEIAVEFRTVERVQKESNFALGVVRKDTHEGECGHDHKADVIAVLEFYRDVILPGLLERTKSFQLCTDAAIAEADGQAVVSITPEEVQ